MLNHLGDDGFVPPSYLSSYPLSEVDGTSVDPVLVKDANPRAERRKVGRDHAPDPMHRPEHEKGDEEVVRVPESLVVRPTRLFNRSENHGHQADEHDPPRPCWTGQKAGFEESNKTLVVLGRELGDVVEMRDCVNPRKKDDRPRDD